MRKTRKFSAIVTVVIVTMACGARTASAQSATTSDVVVSLNAGMRALPQTRTDTVMFDLFVEEGQLATTQTIGPYPAVDVGYGRRLWGRYGLGVSGSFVQGTAIAMVDASVPHPFFFDFPRQVTGMSSRLKQRELGIHISAQMRMGLPLGGRLTFLAGPSVFRVEQDFVVDVSTEERGFPFEDVDITSTTAERQSTSAVGYHVGLDAVFDVASRYGVGVLVRYSRAYPAVVLKGDRQPGLGLGRLQILGGARIGF